MSRHAACKLPVAVVNSRPKKLPVSIKLDSTAVGIIVQVKKVTADVIELQKNMVKESAARNELHMCVEQLKLETAETKRYLVQAATNVRNHTDANKSLQLLLKSLPCKSLDELDWLIAYVIHHTLQWTEYIKLLGGTDFNSAIKTIINTVMDRSVQKELSWNGSRSKKPSLKFKYKEIVDGIHVAMKEQFKDYTIVQGEAKIKSILTNANRKT